LFRRAGFGPTAAWLDQFRGKPPTDALDWIFDYDPTADELNDRLEDFTGLVNFQKIETVQEWCLFRMVYTPHPLQEKMCLFWHDHFATAFDKINNPRLMHVQMELFRRQGLGSFRDLVIAVAKDPAMLIWLDGNKNRRGKPNENFAREVMELFTLGVGHYTEKDVLELSRAFTGWSIADDKGKFNKDAFDDKEKTIFGKKGRYGVEEAVDLLLQQPAAPKFLAERLLKEFVSPNPTPEHIDYYAGRLLASKWDLKVVIREMLASNLFFSDFAIRSKIKSPIEMGIGGALVVGGRANMLFVRESTTKMGQTILQPPNVKGWDGEQTWINSNTVLLRFNYGLALATQRGEEFAKRSPLEKDLLKRNLTSGEQVVDYLAKLLLDGRLQPKFRDELVKYLSAGDGKTVEFKLASEKPNDKVRGLLHLMMSTPEYQLS
jgi:uncharacterized protein (DUF1800 family)